jgi:hypothetical protein
MDDLIPFLIIVAISIIGAATRKKRKPGNVERPAYRPPRMQEDDFLSWINTIADDDEEETVAVKPQKVVRQPVMETANVVDTIPPAKNKFDSYSGFISPQETEAMIKNEGQRVTKTTHFDENDLTKQGSVFKEEEDLKRVKIDFDLRQAVIYSEVLNRKYN